MIVAAAFLDDIFSLLPLLNSVFLTGSRPENSQPTVVRIRSAVQPVALLIMLVNMSEGTVTFLSIMGIEKSVNSLMMFLPLLYRIHSRHSFLLFSVGTIVAWRILPKYLPGLLKVCI